MLAETSEFEHNLLAMLRATEPLLENESEWLLIQERFGELAEGMNAVCGHIEHLQSGITRLRRQARAFADGSASA